MTIIIVATVTWSWQRCRPKARLSEPALKLPSLYREQSITMQGNCVRAIHNGNNNNLAHGNNNKRELMSMLECSMHANYIINY